MSTVRRPAFKTLRILLSLIDGVEPPGSFNKVVTLDILLAGGPCLRAALGELFAREPGYAMREAASLQEALAAIDAARPDALLVSDDFGEDAGALLRAARNAGFAGAALWLAKGEGRGEPGFDAAMRRPLRFGELLFTIRRTLEHLPLRPLRRALGEHSFCPISQRLTAPDGTSRLLTEKEIALLLRLSRAAGGVVGRDVLLREVWGYNGAVVTHTLETHIHRLRRKLEGISGRTGVLLTAPGGYRLCLEDDRAESAETQPPEARGSGVHGAG
jgi:DNA-binding response OmpR family regulator